MDKSWLFDHRTLSRINQCRRLIQVEFGIRLRLADESLLQQLGEFCTKSRSADLAELWRTLVAEVPEIAQTLPGPNVRLYRDQPILQDKNADLDARRQDRKKQVIYRGQRVEG